MQKYSNNAENLTSVKLTRKPLKTQVKYKRKAIAGNIIIYYVSFTFITLVIFEKGYSQSYVNMRIKLG